MHVKNEASMPNIYNTKIRFVGPRHGKFHGLHHIIVVMIKKNKISQLHNNIE
jgi:hypothetical protein